MLSCSTGCQKSGMGPQPVCLPDALRNNLFWCFPTSRGFLQCLVGGLFRVQSQQYIADLHLSLWPLLPSSHCLSWPQPHLSLSRTLVITSGPCSVSADRNASASLALIAQVSPSKKHLLQMAIADKHITNHKMSQRARPTPPSPPTAQLCFKDLGWFWLLTIIWASCFFSFQALNSLCYTFLSTSHSPYSWPCFVASGAPCNSPDLWVRNLLLFPQRCLMLVLRASCNPNKDDKGWSSPDIGFR